MTKFADIHCHSALHPFAYKIAGKKRNNNVWDYDPPRDSQRDSKYPEYSQADFTSLAKGGVKLIYVSFFVSMSHHFFNGFCGHTRSLPSPASLLFPGTWPILIK